MTDKVKQLAPQIWAEIQKANRILLHCHRGADPDSVGGALAMFHALKSIGKKVTVIAGDNTILLPYMSLIPGFEEIVAKNYFEIDINSFDLFIILDSSTLKQISKRGKIVFPESLRTVKIDHHTDTGDFANINLVDVSYPAVCQIIYDLLTDWKIVLEPTVAGCLFAGIYADTGGFKYPPTDSETLLVGSKLAKIYPDFFRIIFQMENSMDPKQLEFLQVGLGSIEHYFSQKVAISVVSFEKLRQLGLDRESVRKEALANMLKSVPGWIIGISLVEVEPAEVELSFRKREFEGPDLSGVAIALGGGGHESAAGATIDKPLGEAKEVLLETLQKVYPELGTP